MKLTRLLVPVVSFLLLSSCDSKQKNEHIVETKASPDITTQVTDVFEQKFGAHEGKRRNHIDGFCFSGHLSLKDKSIKKYSKSDIFNEIPLKVTGRFSHKGGIKKDESTPGEYGMAFEVHMKDGTTHNFSMNTLDFFPVSTPEGFLQLMQAKVSGKEEDFKKLKADHPEFANYKAHYKSKPKVLKSYANHQFNSINTFLFENEAGGITPVRWSFIPKNELIEMDISQEINFFNETQKLLDKANPLTWEMLVTIANDDDKINDASIQWQGEHKQVVAAVLTVEEIALTGACDDINFDPLRLLAGIKPSDDPVLKFRSPAYASSFARRISEKNK